MLSTPSNRQDLPKELQKIKEATNLYKQGVLLYRSSHNEESYECFKQAARGKHLNAVLMFVRMVHRNMQANSELTKGTQSEPEADEELAATLCYSAALKGDSGAQYLLGRLFYDGCGVRRNLTTSLQWIQRAALNGNKSAIEYMTFVSSESFLMA